MSATPEETLTESVELAADQVGISSIHADAVAFLAQEVAFRAKYVLQQCNKHRRVAKRSKLCLRDLDAALSGLSESPVFGVTCRDYVPLRSSTGAGNAGDKDVFIPLDKEIDLDTVLKCPLPKYPVESSLKSHWLAVDGKQPAIPENPLLVPQNAQNKTAFSTPTISNNPSGTNKKASAHNPAVLLKAKPMRFHELSAEQQLYFKEITEACMHTVEERRVEALASLSTDTGLHTLLPRFSAFIAEGVRVNVVIHSSLPILIYLMRMLKSLLNNSSISLEKYLHELVPATFTCIVNKQLVDQHWALRGFAAKCLAQICHTYNNNVNNLQARCVNILRNALNQWNSIGLPTLYGVVSALGELGLDTVRRVLFPFVKQLSDLIEQVPDACHGAPLDAAEEARRKAADQLKSQLIKYLVNTVHNTMSDLTNFNDFKVHFGAFLGHPIYTEVNRLRTAAAANNAASSHSAIRQVPTRVDSGGGGGYQGMRQAPTPQRYQMQPQHTVVRDHQGNVIRRNPVPTNQMYNMPGAYGNPEVKMEPQQQQQQYQQGMRPAISPNAQQYQTNYGYRP